MADTTNATITVSDDEFDHWPPSETSEVPVIVTNAVSVAACLAVLVSYFIFRRKHKRIMERNSLVLAVSMAAADLLLHSINLFGYSDLPDGFICEFFGGFLYAFPTLISLFYSFNIALNTQLVFVFGKRPGQSKLKYYISIPILLSLCICIPALATHIYGFDVSFDMCWYKTKHKNSRQVLLPYFFTFAFWCLMVVAYLIVAGISITFAVFSKTSRLNHLATNLSKSLSSNSHHAGSAPHMMVAGMAATSNLPMQAQATLSSGKGQQISSFGMSDSDEIGGVGDGRGRKLTYGPQQQERHEKQKRQWLTSNQQRREFDRDPMILTHKSDFEMDATGISALSKQVGGDQYHHHQYGRSPAVSSKQTATMMSMHGRSVPVVPPNQTLSRRSLAMRALALRLLGYITIPMICILPGVIDDLLIKAIPSRGPDIPGVLSTCFDSLNGLIGLMNAILYALDPALLALYHQIKVERQERKKRNDMAFTSPTASRMDTQTYEPHSRPYHHHNRMASLGGATTPGPYSADLELSNVHSRDDNGSFKYNNYNDNEDVQVRTEGRMNPRKTRFLSPFLKRPDERMRHGTVQSSLPQGSVRQTTSAFGGGIVIRVDVQVDRDDIDRLEHYLVGL
ncbi:hypothetical protein CPB86DRAFT_811450 [Serendipita vermifera]|nr:hypothetical protein CPB86DRAFT_811450 [Serendipita vermifera]